MANLKSSKLDIIKSREKHLLNQRHKGQMRGAIRRARTAIDAGTGTTPEAIRQAMTLIDRAASRGAIHPNQAARRKSRLAQRLNAKS